MPPRGQAEQERQQLWAIYWGIRALDRPPPTLRMARSELWSILDRPESPATPVTGSNGSAEVRHLTLVGGES